MIRYATAAALGTLITVTAVAIRITFRNFQREARATLADVQRTASAWRDEQPAPYLTDLGEHAADAIAVTAPCALCDLGLGHCVCTVRCVADACTGRTTFVTWTEHDFTFAARHGFSLPERSEHQ